LKQILIGQRVWESGEMKIKRQIMATLAIVFQRKIGQIISVGSLRTQRSFSNSRIIKKTIEN
jgi:hypothetical protein